METANLWQHSQDRQRTRLQLRSNALLRRIANWSKYALLYLPGVAVLRSLVSNPETEIKPQDIPLWLPSQIRGQVPFDIRLARIEWKLREAQAHEALDAVRHNLQMRTHLYKFKDRFIRGQSANTRARNLITSVGIRIKKASEEYRAAYMALTSLAPLLFSFVWTGNSDLLPLLDDDIRGLPEPKKGQSEGRRTVSWPIWRTVAVEGVEDEGCVRDRKSEFCMLAS